MSFDRTYLTRKDLAGGDITIWDLRTTRADSERMHPRRKQQFERALATISEVVADPEGETITDDLATRLRDWLHETPLTLCDRGSDSCADWDLAFPMARAIQTNANEDWDRLRELTTQRIGYLAEYEKAR